METDSGETVHAVVYDNGDMVAQLTNKAIIPEFEESGIWEVERL